MPSGSCFCGKSSIKYEAEPAMKVRASSPPPNSHLYLLSYSALDRTATSTTTASSPAPPSSSPSSATTVTTTSSAAQRARPRPPKRTASDKVKVLSSDTSYQALCHCDDCKKISGGAYSVNVVVSDQGYEARGPLKKISKVADSGKAINSYFCAECGTTMYRDGDSFPGMKIIKAGVLDDKGALNEVAKPQTELYTSVRVDWLPALEGAEQKQGMS